MHTYEVCRSLALRWNVLPRQPQFGPSHNLDEFIILRKAYKYKSSLRCTGTGSRIPLLLNIVVIPNALHVLRPQTDTERRRLFWLFFIVLCFIYAVLLLRAVFLVGLNVGLRRVVWGLHVVLLLCCMQPVKGHGQSRHLYL